MEEYHPYIRCFNLKSTNKKISNLLTTKSFCTELSVIMRVSLRFMCPLSRSGMTCGRLSTVLYKAGITLRSAAIPPYKKVKKHKSRSCLAFGFAPEGNEQN
jgi:hypothetical protein